MTAPIATARGGGAVALRSHSVHLELGRFGFDIVSRPLAMALVQVPTADGRPEEGSPIGGDTAERDSVDAHIGAVVAHRPAIIQVSVSELAGLESMGAYINEVVQHFDGPVAVQTSSSLLAHEAFKSGAAAVHDPSGLADPNMLTVIVDSGASVIVGCPPAMDDQVSFLRERVRWAKASGIAPSRIVVDAPADLAGALQHLGVAVMVRTGSEPEAQGIHVKAVMAGARIVCGRDVVATRRTIDTVGELLARRHAESSIRWPPGSIANGSSRAAPSN